MFMCGILKHEHPFGHESVTLQTNFSSSTSSWKKSPAQHNDICIPQRDGEEKMNHEGLGQIDKYCSRNGRDSRSNSICKI